MEAYMDNQGLKGVPQKAVASGPKSSTSMSKGPAAVAGAAPIRPFARKVRKKSTEHWFVRLRNASGFTIAIGLLVTAVGLICFIPWHNQFSKIMLDLGLITTFYGFFIKMLDILIRVITER